MEFPRGHMQRWNGQSVLLAVCVLLGGCRQEDRPAAAPAGAPREVTTARRPDPFSDVTEKVGLEFHHFTGATGRYHIPEITGAGCAVFDFDNDGDLDVYAVQTSLLSDEVTMRDVVFPYHGQGVPRNRLFRNDLEQGKLRFTDVTDASGTGHPGCGMGCAVGDYNNDGFADLYVTNLGPNVLYRNNGNGTFTDVTAEAGVDDRRWSTSAAFADLNGDGRLDLMVVNYLNYQVAADPDCTSPTGEPDFCHPLTFKPTGDSLFIQRGNGRFENVSAATGIDRSQGNGLGVVCADFDGDDRPDIYVANDAMPNRLWMNRSRGGVVAFEEQALLSGAAVNADGMPEAGMGVTAQDFDLDGDLDIFVTHLTGESNTLYLNDGSARFRDATAEFALAAPSHPFTAFGTLWFDYDNDGLLDLFSANGTVNALESASGDPYPYHQPNQLFRQVTLGKFEDVSARSGPVFAASEVSRGVAFGDVDNDGDTDLVVSNNNGPLRLLLNEVGAQNHWLTLHLEGRTCNRQAIGARVALTLPNGQTVSRRVHTDGSYCSANDPRVFFGLEAFDSPGDLVVRWPDGRAERWRGLSIDSEVHLRQGEGEAL